MLQVFKHIPEEGFCIHISLDIESSDSYLEMAANFLYGKTAEITGTMGFSKLHPDDKNYKKSTARDVSVANSKPSNFSLFEVQKSLSKRTTLVFVSEDGSTAVKVLVNDKKRPHLRIY